jgi:2,3-dihydroxybenzoate decarboxylase
LDLNIRTPNLFLYRASIFDSVTYLHTPKAKMLGKIALEECWTIPEALKNNDPGRFVAAGSGDRLTRELLDIHDSRLRQMDENGVEFMVLSLVSAGAQGIADPAKAEALATLANDRLEQEVMKNPTRFAAFAAVSMHNPQQAAEELAYCMTKRKGFVGVLLNDFQSSGPDGNTMLFFDQPEYDVFWEACNDLKAPVYLHPRISSRLIHDQMRKGRSWVDFSALGYADRLNMHILGIITNGVLDRFPDVKLIFGHMGEHM